MNRPECFECAMSYIGGLQESEVRAYVRYLETRLSTAPPHRPPDTVDWATGEHYGGYEIRCSETRSRLTVYARKDGVNGYAISGPSDDPATFRNCLAVIERDISRGFGSTEGPPEIK